MKWYRIIPVLLLAGMLIAGCGGGVDLSSPEATLSTLQSAAKQWDPEKMWMCLEESEKSPGEKAEFLEEIGEEKEEVQKVFSGMELVERALDEGDHVAYKVKLDGKESPKKLEFHKYGDKWLIANF